MLFKEYVVLGIEHILSGYDHLSFVFCLLLLALNIKRLLFAISAFTLSHSITLAFGILGIINIGVPYVESMIALSILFLAREIMIERDTFTKRHLGLTAFTFGLLHGLGFSSVLRSLGLPQDDLVLALLAFNAGIEVGQILFILFASFALFLLHKMIGKYQLKRDRFFAYAIGTLSAYWFIQRVLAF
jgi:hydrogenase/urease accessory protein HupE